jgi:aldehyde:ferredoxin oxidoreductase
VDFYCGRVLRLDLTTGRSSVEPLDLEWAELYVGGKGLLLRYLWEEVPPGIDPWAPENPVILMTGPFAGTNVTTASRLVVGCKSPATGILNDSYVGGSFAPEMKFAGYDAIIITGSSPEPVVVTVRDDVVEFLPAKPSYWGLPTSEIEEAMRRDFDPQAKTLSIGPAGEHEILFACLSTDQYHKAGRGGLGALWGRKQLKAIAVRGTGSVRVGDARAFLDELYLMHRDRILTEDNLWAHEEGTPTLTQVMSDAGVMPTRNWSSGSFEEVEAINSDAFLEKRTKNRACYQCAIGCRQFHDVAGVVGEGPEYETIAMCGANCGVGDMEALVRFNQACDELGLDTISTGNVVGLAMDLAEQGAAEFDLRFGETGAYLQAPELIARREGAGAELALGSRELAARYGRPDLAMEVKKLELPGYDPRGSFTMSIAYATADRGGCHMRSYPIAAEVIGGTLAPDTLDGKAHKLIHGDPAEDMIGEDFCATKFSGIWCDFWAIGPGEVAQLLGDLWDREVTREEVFRLGARVWNLGRLFNLREGVEPDDLPRRLYAEEGAHTSGASAGRAIGAERFRAALREVYALRGWDEQGVPSEATLSELGVDVRLGAAGAPTEERSDACPTS